jgi:hypothetical protein
MGYSISIIDRSKSITEKVLDITIKQLPKRLSSKGETMPSSKQSWGWSLRTDVSLRKNQNGIEYVNVSGSFGGSGEWALDMVVALQQLLQRQGYQIEIFSTDFGFCNKVLYAWMGYDIQELKEEENFCCD